MTRAFRRDHDHIQIRPRLHQLEVDVQTMAESEHRALANIRFDFITINGRVFFIGCQQHDEVRLRHRRRDTGDTETSTLCLHPGVRAFAQTDDHLDARILQIICMRMTLRTVTNHRHGARLDQGKIGIFVVVDLHGDLKFVKAKFLTEKTESQSGDRSYILLTKGPLIYSLPRINQVGEQSSPHIFPAFHAGKMAVRPAPHGKL